MHVTFDLLETQQARKYLEAELVTPWWRSLTVYSYLDQIPVQSRIQVLRRPNILLLVFVVSVSSLSSSLSSSHKPSIPPISHSGMAMCTEARYNEELMFN